MQKRFDRVRETAELLYVGGGGGYPDIPDGPSASQMPDFGMPDAGMMDDMGGFDFPGMK